MNEGGGVMDDELKEGRGRGRDIRERTLEYALRAIKLFQFLQEGKDKAGEIIGKQYLRSATSIGAIIFTTYLTLHNNNNKR
ncbi:MAG: hypothetical protein DSM106950_15405 [Stigonema ocellatum SAG 48.90 = DSM 106950]|nr:hypothetical protein [Stigonema ocellatum SAG 48.90 = DSM 106950]